MKSILVLIYCIITGACCTAQVQKNAVGKEDCTTEFPLLLTYEFNGFHFNSRTTSCERGFWVNFTGGKWSSCCQQDINSNPCRALITTNNHVRIVIELHEKYTLLHFPLALSLRPGYAAKDSAFLIMDKDYELGWGNIKTRLLAGEYPVKQAAGEWLIEVANEQTMLLAGVNQ